MDVDFDHYVITRFCIGQLDPAHLRYRMKLFRTFCQPAIESQSSAKFHWLVLGDRCHPEPIKEELRTLVSRTGGLIWFTHAEPRFASILARLYGYFQSQASYMLTTRLDDDDCIASDFVYRVQQAAMALAAPSPNMVRMLHCRHGFRFRSGCVSPMHLVSNPFLSVWTPIPADWANLKTCYTASVDDVRWHTEVTDDPMWIYVRSNRSQSENYRSPCKIPAAELRGARFRFGDIAEFC